MLLKIATGTDGDKGKIYLDDAVLAGRRVQGVLNVALAHNTEVPNYVDRGRPEHVVVGVRQRLRRCHHNGIASVDPERVKVLRGTVH